MSALREKLLDRSGNTCEFCKSEQELDEYQIDKDSSQSLDNMIWTCKSCREDMKSIDTLDTNKWRLLSESMWSEHRPVLVQSYVMLRNLSREDWVEPLLDMMYMDDETQKYAEKVLLENQSLVHKDSNGNTLSNGDTVTLIKDLKVKGSSLVAKRGTAVRRITLDPSNAQYIEGKVEGQKIVIITDYVKKS